MHLAQRPPVVGHVLDHLVHQSHVDRALAQGDVVQVADGQTSIEIGGGRGDLLAREFDAPGVCPERAQRLHIVAGAAAAVDDALATNGGIALDDPDALGQVLRCRRVTSGRGDVLVAGL